jgi:hypothetical protein
MIRLICSAIALAMLLSAPLAQAQTDDKCVVDIRGNRICGTRSGQCILDRYRIAWCAPANGRAMTDINGEVVCGAGACVTDPNGRIQCSAAADGIVSTSPSNQISCTGGCVIASKATCRRASPD